MEPVPPTALETSLAKLRKLQSLLKSKSASTGSSPQLQVMALQQVVQEFHPYPALVRTAITATLYSPRVTHPVY